MFLYDEFSQLLTRIEYVFYSFCVIKCFKIDNICGGEKIFNRALTNCCVYFKMKTK